MKLSDAPYTTLLRIKATNKSLAIGTIGYKTRIRNDDVFVVTKGNLGAHFCSRFRAIVELVDLRFGDIEINVFFSILESGVLGYKISANHFVAITGNFGLYGVHEDVKVKLFDGDTITLENK